jgi:hypothetical protein
LTCENFIPYLHYNEQKGDDSHKDNARPTTSTNRAKPTITVEAGTDKPSNSTSRNSNEICAVLCGTDLQLLEKTKLIHRYGCQSLLTDLISFTHLQTGLTLKGTVCNCTGEGPFIQVALDFAFSG